MKFTPEVVAALTVLRNAAENDFERHRLDVLQRDLTAPPQVEIIDDTHQRFNGITYVMSKKEGHYVKNIPLHRVVFAYNYGAIPDGYDIHHDDENKSNNNISNLLMLTASKHRIIHNTRNKKAPLKRQCPVCGKIFFTTRKTKQCCSKICGKLLAISNKNKNHQKKQYKKICLLCGKTFITDAAKKKKKYCSAECAHKATQEKNLKQRAPKICPVCNKEFLVDRNNRKNACCSRTCARKLFWKKKKAQDSLS